MDISTVVEHVQQVAAVRADGAAATGDIEAGLRSIGRLQSWLTASRTALTAQLSEQVSFPEKTASDCTRGSTRDAINDQERADTLGSVPSFGDALDNGDVTAGHVDALTNTAKHLDNDEQRDVHTVVVRNGVVLHAPGELHLGRTTRLANRAQRRALRALYATCAIPGCSVRYDRCKLHHIVWWRNGGRTDLDNLVPVCAHHHSKIHDNGWDITVGPNRELTIRFPDGTIHNTGPPTRNAA
jgi:hypothetical protein